MGITSSKSDKTSASSSNSSSFGSLGEAVQGSQAVSAFAIDYANQEKDPFYRSFWYFVEVKATGKAAGGKLPYTAQFVGAEMVFSDNDMGYFDRLPRRSAKQPIVCFEVHRNANEPVPAFNPNAERLNVPYTLKPTASDGTKGTLTFDANKEYPQLEPAFSPPQQLNTTQAAAGAAGNTTSVASLLRNAMATGDGVSSAVTLTYALTRTAQANTLVLTSADTGLQWTFSTAADRAAKK